MVFFWLLLDVVHFSVQLWFKLATKQLGVNFRLYTKCSEKMLLKHTTVIFPKFERAWYLLQV